MDNMRARDIAVYEKPRANCSCLHHLSSARLLPPLLDSHGITGRWRRTRLRDMAAAHTLDPRCVEWLAAAAHNQGGMSHDGHDYVHHHIKQYIFDRVNQCSKPS
jgi:hypothetical protein